MTADHIRLISSMAAREVLAELALQFTNHSGIAVQTHSAGGVDVAKRVAGGEGFEVVVLAADAIDRLAHDGYLSPGSRIDLMRSGIAVAMQSGQTRRLVDSEEAVKQAVLAASSVGYSTGPSGNYLVQLFRRWGIFDQIEQRIVQAPPGVPVAALLARGEVELGFQQLSELLHAPGITVLGPLPASIQSITVFAGGLTPTALRMPSARALLDFMASDAAAAAKRRQGMDPA